MPNKDKKTASQKSTLYSVVIPVYNSEKIVGKTIDRVISFFESKNWEFELLLVNDNSPDKSWPIIKKRALNDDRIIAINMGKNFGQHTANIVGFRHVKGDCVITMDDDLQNPPEEIEKLAEKFHEGFDLVVGVFEQKKHASHRRIGSQMMQFLNKKIFPSPEGFRHTNFRLIARSVIDRIVEYRNHFPYTSGMAIMFSSHQTNALVKHADREIGKSNYNLKRLIKLAWSIIFNYSALPIRVLVTLGLVISLFSLLIAAFMVIRAFVLGNTGTGWTSLMLVISISNSVLFLLLSIIGEYLAVLSRQVRMDRHFFVNEVVGYKPLDKNRS